LRQHWPQQGRLACGGNFGGVYQKLVHGNAETPPDLGGAANLDQRLLTPGEPDVIGWASFVPKHGPYADLAATTRAPGKLLPTNSLDPRAAQSLPRWRVRGPHIFPATTVCKKSTPVAVSD
jgi:hypothetical protein